MMSDQDLNVDENIARQLEEIEALKAIYNEDFYSTDSESKTCEITLIRSELNPKFSTSLRIVLPINYPSSGEPVLEIISSWMVAKDYEEMAKNFQEIFDENVGEIILFQCIEKLREFVKEKTDERQEMRESSFSFNSVDPDKNGELHITDTLNNISFDNHDDDDGDGDHDDDESIDFEIMHGEPMTDRKSTFQSHLALISSRNQAHKVLAELMKNRKIANAAHNVMAYRIYNEEKNAYIQDCDDDGENAAGSRLLHLMQITDVRNVIVVVTHWYGGLLLGPDRFKHYNNCARDLLQAAGLVENKVTQDQRESRGKSKAKVKKHR